MIDFCKNVSFGDGKYHIRKSCTIQQSMKVKRIFSDCMAIVGCVIGIGFVTGKEAQVFVGSDANIWIFVAIFGISTLVLRQFCAKRKLKSTQQFVTFAFGKGGVFLHLALLGCYFVCLVTTFATVQSSFEQLFDVHFPLWSALVAVACGIILKGGIKSFKTISALAFISAFVTFLFISPNKTAVDVQVNPLLTVVYGLFSLTMVLPVCCDDEKSLWESAISVVIATAVVGVALWWIGKIADFRLTLPVGGRLQGFGKVCLCVTICLCGISGAVANALPVYQGLCDVVKDKALLRFLVVGLSWAFSCVGLDFLLKYGYLFVALVGLAIVLRCVFAKKNPTIKMAG